MKVGFTLIQGFFSALIILLKGMLWLFVPILGILIVFGILVIYRYFYYRYILHMTPIKKDFDVERKTSFFENFFILWPKMLAKDLLKRDPNDFDKFGIHIVVGEQGSGKTMTVAYLLQEWRKRYPNLKIYTNMAYQYEDGELSHWRQLIERTNGIYGFCNLIVDFMFCFTNGL